MAGARQGYRATERRVTTDIPVFIDAAHRRAETTANAAKRRCVETVERIVPRSVRDLRLPILWAAQENPIPNLEADDIINALGYLPAMLKTARDPDAELINTFTFRDVYPTDEMAWLVNPDHNNGLHSENSKGVTEVSDTEDSEDEHDMGVVAGAHRGAIDTEGTATEQADTEDGATVDEEMNEFEETIDPEGNATVQADTEDDTMDVEVEEGEEVIDLEGEAMEHADTEDGAADDQEISEGEEIVDPEGNATAQADTEDDTMDAEVEEGEDIIDPEGKAMEHADTKDSEAMEEEAQEGGEDDNIIDPESEATSQADTEDDEAMEEELEDEDGDEEAEPEGAKDEGAEPEDEEDEAAEPEDAEDEKAEDEEADDEDMDEDAEEAQDSINPEGRATAQADTDDEENASQSDTDLESDDDDLKTIYLDSDDEEAAKDLNRLALKDDSGEKVNDTKVDASLESEKKEDVQMPVESPKTPSKALNILAAPPSPEDERMDTANNRIGTRAQRRREAEEKARKEEEERQAAEAERRRRLYRVAPEESIITPISAELKSKVDEILDCGPRVQISEYQGQGVERQNFSTLIGSTAWLNDEMVNKSIDQTVSHVLDLADPPRGTTPPIHAFNSFFFDSLSKKGPSGMTGWARRAKIGGTKLLEVDTLFIPINEGHSHWTLMVISPSLRTVEYFDSFHTGGEKHFDHIKSWLACELGNSFKPNEWTFRDGVGPSQKNGYDCGVFVVSTVKSIAFGWDPQFAYKSKDMAAQRWRIAAEILTNKKSMKFEGELEPSLAEGRLERIMSNFT